MQSKDVIEVVTPLGGRISEVTLFPDVTALLAGIGVYWWSRTAVRHLSSVESHVALFVRSVEILVIGEVRESGVERTPRGGRPQSRSTDESADIHGIPSVVATA
jgi:hypothetical protein